MAQKYGLLCREIFHPSAKTDYMTDGKCSVERTSACPGECDLGQTTRSQALLYIIQQR